MQNVLWLTVLGTEVASGTRLFGIVTKLISEICDKNCVRTCLNMECRTV